jgi:hypothetical protein
MRRLSLLLVLASGMWPVAASAQLVREEVQGMERICIYRGNATILSAPDREIQHRTAIGENCPITSPVVMQNQKPPPGAPLVQSDVVNGSRVCVYEQFGSQWSYSLPLETACPPGAGMIEASRREGR